jgi:hypothetical protein
MPVSRPPPKQSPVAAPARMTSWAIYKLGSTPAKLLGHIDAPDEARPCSVTGVVKRQAGGTPPAPFRFIDIDNASTVAAIRRS